EQLLHRQIAATSQPRIQHPTRELGEALELPVLPLERRLEPPRELQRGERAKLRRRQPEKPDTDTLAPLRPPFERRQAVVGSVAGVAVVGFASSPPSPFPNTPEACSALNRAVKRCVASPP